MKFRVSVKNRNEFNDYDYLHILSAKDYDWLRRFHREYLNADFQHYGDQVHPDELKKDCYGMNNSRNRDTYAIAKVTGNLFPTESIGFRGRVVSPDKNLIDRLLHLDDYDLKGGFVHIIEDFRKSKPDIIKYVKKNGIGDINLYAAGGAVPLYAIWTFIGEEFPEHLELVIKKKKALKAFYGYKVD